jgi:hypothetical protein
MKDRIKAIIESEWHLPTPQAIEHLAAKIAAEVEKAAKEPVATPDPHLALPLRQRGSSKGLIEDATGDMVCAAHGAWNATHTDTIDGTQEARRDFILNAVNSHDALVKIARAAYLYHGPEDLSTYEACPQVGIDVDDPGKFAAHIATILKSCGEVL